LRSLPKKFLAASALTILQMSENYHTPVLLKSCIEFLNIKPGGTYVDLTFGGGGHSRSILENLDGGRLFAFDQDEDAKRNVVNDERFTLIPQNFRLLRKYLRVYGVATVDGILGDLGVSSHQFDEPSRGFSIRSEGQLDMRMNRQSDKDAKQVVNTYDERALATLLRNYGELPNAGKIAKLIVLARQSKEIETTSQLQDVIDPAIPREERNKFLARVFQAIRIEVNEEMHALEECLTQCAEVLNPGGRLVVMSYHSLEDRMVKNLMRTGRTDGVEERDVIYGTTKKIFRILTSKPVTADENEINANPRARSARLRAAEKI
jgi:16S rRNA (cytosine1402-N4)-methyltransferase